MIASLIQQIRTQLDQTFDKPFLIILIFYFSSFWFFSFWVSENHGIYWGSPTGIAHHPFNLNLFDTDFWQTLTYMFVQGPLYSLLTWLMLKINVQSNFIAYLFLHYFVGLFTLLALYKINQQLKIPSLLNIIFLSHFVFNPGFYFEFASGWNDFLSMCLISLFAFSLLRLLNYFNSFNLILCLSILTFLVAYRTLFHPITFFIPMVLLLCLLHLKQYKKILLYALLPFLIALAPYVKNKLIFDSFTVGIGQFAAALKSPTFQWASQEQLIKDVDEGKLSRLVFCFNRKFHRVIIYKGIIYSQENCKNHLIPEFAASEVEKILIKHPSLGLPAILMQKNNAPILDDHISNTLAGHVIAKQMIKDAKAFMYYHPDLYFDAVKRNFANLFKSNALYEFDSAHNSRHYPIWFGQRFDLAWYKMIAALNDPSQQVFSSGVYNPFIAIGIVCTLVYAFLYAGGTRYAIFLSIIHLSGLLLMLIFMRRRYAYLDFALIWSALYLVFGLALTIKRVFLAAVLNNNPSDKHESFIALLGIICMYYFAIILLVPGSEQERYRFGLEGLLISLFLFWITRLSNFMFSRLSFGCKRGNQTATVREHALN